MKIGLTQRVLYHKNRAYDSIEHGWYSFLKEHTLVFIPNRTDQDFVQLAEELDLLIITGGDDSAIRRTTELKLASQMLMRLRPVIGICHGAFLLTDVLGGKITEDVMGHMDLAHDINYFGERVLVNSYHTLGIQKVHDRATILCTDLEGNCEAWIDKNVAGVVWHPERMKTPWLPDEIQNLIK